MDFDPMLDAARKLVDFEGPLGWEHSAKNELVLGARVHRFHAESRAIRGYIDRIHRRFPATRETTDSDTG